MQYAPLHCVRFIVYARCASIQTMYVSLETTGKKSHILCVAIDESVYTFSIFFGRTGMKMKTWHFVTRKVPFSKNIQKSGRLLRGERCVKNLKNSGTSFLMDGLLMMQNNHGFLIKQSSTYLWIFLCCKHTCIFAYYRSFWNERLFSIISDEFVLEHPYTVWITSLCNMSSWRQTFIWI